MAAMTDHVAIYLEAYERSIQARQQHAAGYHGYGHGYESFLPGHSSQQQAGLPAAGAEKLPSIAELLLALLLHLLWWAAKQVFRLGVVGAVVYMLYLSRAVWEGAVRYLVAKARDREMWRAVAAVPARAEERLREAWLSFRYGEVEIRNGEEVGYVNRVEALVGKAEGWVRGALRYRRAVLVAVVVVLLARRSMVAPSLSSSPWASSSPKLVTGTLGELREMGWDVPQWAVDAGERAHAHSKGYDVSARAQQDRASRSRSWPGSGWHRPAPAAVGEDIFAQFAEKPHTRSDPTTTGTVTVTGSVPETAAQAERQSAVSRHRQAPKTTTMRSIGRAMGMCRHCSQSHAWEVAE